MQDPLAPAPAAPFLSLTSTTRVPNIFPTVDVPYRLAIIGDAPGETEEQHGQPFLGATGKLLDSVLGGVGVLRAGCYVGNVCQYRPPGGDLKTWGYDHPRVVEGRERLHLDLASFKPNCILALGNAAMWAVTGKPFGLKDSGYSIEDYTNFIGVNDAGQKYVGAYHPSQVLREYSNWVLLRFAAQRARQEAESPTFTPPQRHFDLDLSASEICHKLDTWPSGLNASIDIEGGLGGWICLSVVSAHNYGFIIAFGQYTENEQARVYQAVSRFLYRSDVPKVLQNSLYEGFVLGYGFNMRVRNVHEDTMLKSWEIYPELPKGLDTVASLWTREPAWKHLIAYSKKEQARRAKLPDYDPAREIRNKHLACCIDSAVTLEASDAQNNVLNPDAKRHYRFNMDLLPGLLYMELRGIRYDNETARLELGQVNATLAECSTRLELRAGSSLTGAKGSISSQKLSRLLYQTKGYPVQYKGRGPTKKVSADVEALLNLSKKFPHDALLSDVLLHRKLESIRETLEVATDPDGRVRCGYNLVGTETGRLTCYTSPTGSGANLQTITKKLRKLYTADSGMWLFQCDLSGADGWTVAARCLAHGDATMWDDYNAGIKPAKVIALMYEHGASVTVRSREELRDRCKAVDGDGWLYFACKAVQHGCYTADHELLTPSGWKPIAECENEIVMTYNNQTRELAFDHQQRFVSFDYNGQLHSFEGTAFDLCVTHDHKMPFTTNNSAKETIAEDLAQRKSGKLPTSGFYRQGATHVPAELIAVFQSDGCLTDRGYITFHFSKERKIARLIQLLSKYDVPYSAQFGADGTWQCLITNSEWVAIISRWTKNANSSMLSWRQEHLATYLEEYPHWDGTFGETGSITIFSINKEHLDWIATFASLVGRGFTWQKSQISGFGSLVHRLQLNNRSYANRANLDKVEARPVTNERVFCVTVPSGFVLVRRNGKIMVSGNSNYGMQEKTMSINIMKQSYKMSGTAVHVEPAVCASLQRLYFLRYPGLYQWHEWAKQQVFDNKNLTSSSGNTRVFFGRRKTFNPKRRCMEADQDTWKAFLAHEPQANTTYATNLALHRLWHDPENRQPNGDDGTGSRLIIEPLHQVHDALIGQFPKTHTDWAVAKIREYFNNTLQIANSSLVIPFEGAYGPSWGEQGSKYGGGEI